jgi:ribosome-associated protein
MHRHDEDPGLEEFAGPSKSELKRRSEELQDLGVALAELPPAELDALPLPETLRDAIEQLRRTTGRGGLLRQRQYVGKLMRQVDAEPIRAALEARHLLDRARVQREKRVEQWRDRLLAEGEPALAVLLRERPRANRRELAALIAQAAAERNAARPPAAARRLFQRLRTLLDDESAA